MRLASRVAVWCAICLCASFLLLLALLYPVVSASLERADRSLITEEVNELRALHATGGLPRVVEFLEAQRSAGAAEPLLIHVVDTAGQTRFLHRPHDLRWVDTERVPAPSGPGPAWSTLVGPRGRRADVVSVVVTGDATFRVGHSATKRMQTLQQLRTTALMALGPAVLLGLAGGWLLARSVLGPLRDIIDTVRRIEVGTIQARVPTRGMGDELDELGRLFNGMLERIETLIRAMRSALDDAAHELRTPLTRLRGTAEIALRPGADLSSCREALADCVEESDRLLVLLNTLMDISEVETGALRLARNEVDVGRLLEDVLDLYRDAAEARGIAIKSAGADDLRVLGDHGRLRQALANVVDNAIKYTPAGGRVELSARARNGDVVIAVSDTGMGITPQELPQIWKRLYRSDRARAEPGLGLGLSLVHAIVHAHAGTIEVASPPGAGATFALVLPAATAPPSRVHADITAP